MFVNKEILTYLFKGRWCCKFNKQQATHVLQYMAVSFGAPRSSTRIVSLTLHITMLSDNCYKNVNGVMHLDFLCLIICLQFDSSFACLIAPVVTSTSIIIIIIIIINKQRLTQVYLESGRESSLTQTLPYPQSNVIRITVKI